MVGDPQCGSSFNSNRSMSNSNFSEVQQSFVHVAPPATTPQKQKIQRRDSSNRNPVDVEDSPTQRRGALALDVEGSNADASFNTQLSSLRSSVNPLTLQEIVESPAGGVGFVSNDSMPNVNPSEVRVAVPPATPPKSQPRRNSALVPFADDGTDASVRNSLQSSLRRSNVASHNSMDPSALREADPRCGTSFTSNDSMPYANLNLHHGESPAQALSPPESTPQHDTTHSAASPVELETPNDGALVSLHPLEQVPSPQKNGDVDTSFGSNNSFNEAPNDAPGILAMFRTQANSGQLKSALRFNSADCTPSASTRLDGAPGDSVKAFVRRVSFVLPTASHSMFPRPPLDSPQCHPKPSSFRRTPLQRYSTPQAGFMEDIPLDYSEPGSRAVTPHIPSMDAVLAAGAQLLVPPPMLTDDSRRRDSAESTSSTHSSFSGASGPLAAFPSLFETSLQMEPTPPPGAPVAVRPSSEAQLGVSQVTFTVPPVSNAGSVPSHRCAPLNMERAETEFNEATAVYIQVVPPPPEGSRPDRPGIVRHLRI